MILILRRKVITNNLNLRKSKWKDAGSNSSLFFALFLTFAGHTYTNAQQPGGVHGTMQWYKAESFRGNKVLKDVSRPYWKQLGASNSDVTFNFHPSVFFDNQSRPKAVFENLAYNQAMAFAVFYPEQPQASSNQILFSYNTIREALRYTESTRDEKSMKIAYHYWSTPKLFLNTWGEEKRSTIETNFRGYISELILYNHILEPLEIRKIRTYLSIKYALTLDSTYVDESGKVLWDPLSPLMKEYHNRVCAIGKNRAMSIFQPISTTSNESAYDSKYAYDNPSHGNPGNINIIPIGDSISTRRSITIGYSDRTLNNLRDKSLLFWGDNDKGIALEKKPTDSENYPNLFLTERKWMIWNPSKSAEQLDINVSGGLQEEIYDSYDYHFNRFVLAVYNKDHTKIEKTFLFNHFGRVKFRDERRGRMDFRNNRIIWKNISLNDSASRDSLFFIAFGKIPLMRIFEINGSRVAGIEVPKDEPISSTIKLKPVPITPVDSKLEKVDVPISFTQGVAPYYFRLFRKLENGKDSLILEDILSTDTSPFKQAESEDDADYQGNITEMHVDRRPASGAKKRRVIYYVYTIPHLLRNKTYYVKIEDKAGQLADIELNIK